MVQIKPEELTTESFAPYGRVLEVPDHACTKQGAGWVCWSPVDFMLPDAPVGVGIVRCGQAPQITALERHVSREELLWTTTRDVVMAVDLPVRLGDALARPNIETTRVFRIKRGRRSSSRARLAFARLLRCRGKRNISSWWNKKRIWSTRMHSPG